MATPSSFDLEKALATWRQFHIYRRVFLEEDLDELEQHLRDHIGWLTRQGMDVEEAFRTAVQALGDIEGGEEEYSKVFFHKLVRRHHLLTELSFRLSMFQNYLKIALRNLRRQKGSSFINLFGLSVGITCCLLIGLYARHEWSYDRFHTKADRLYRYTYEHRLGTNLPPATPFDFNVWGSAPVAPALKADFPEIEQTVRLMGRHQILLTRGDRHFQEERYFYSDPAFFEVFSYPLLQGNPATVLSQPNSIVLAESAVRRYFGDEEALGQTLHLETSMVSGELTVTGIMAEVPTHSHLDFDMVISMSTFEQAARANDAGYMFDNWGYVDFFSYILLREGTSVEALQAKLPEFVQRHVGEYMQDPPQTYTIVLESIAEAYLSPVGGFQPGPKGSVTNLYLFSFIGLFILLIACVNFMNLATAHAARRAKEVGIRKTVGARRISLVGQFLTEAMLLAAVSTIAAVIFAQLALPFFHVLAGKAIPGPFQVGLPLFGVLLVGILVIGLLAGSYPAVVLSAFRPSHVLKGSFATSRVGIWLRKGLVVFQFTTAITLIVGTLVVRQQLHYLQGRALGFDDTQQLVLDFGGDPTVRENLESIELELEALPSVEQVSVTRSVPGSYFPHAGTQIESPEGNLRAVVYALYEIDADFLPQIGAEATAGRFFSEAFATDTTQALLLNEAAARDLGYTNPADVVGKRFAQWGREGQIVGVVKDFNYESLHHRIRPLTFRLSPELNFLVLKVITRDVSRVVEDVRARWAALAPHRPFLFSFLDQSFDDQYRAEDRFGNLFGTFAVLAIFVACLGLFGLASFATEQRTKEIGVRKALGASVTHIVALLTREFVRMVLLASVVALPLGYVLAQRWLEDFAYRMSIPGWIFLTAALAALCVALITVSYQALKAALTDPVKSLRYE